MNGLSPGSGPMLNPLEAVTITRACVQAKTLLEQVKPILDGIDLLYNAAGGTGFKDTIDQADLDAATNLSGLTKQQLDDGMFALTTIKNQMVNAFAQIEQLAVRA